MKNKVYYDYEVLMNPILINNRIKEIDDNDEVFLETANTLNKYFETNDESILIDFLYESTSSNKNQEYLDDIREIFRRKRILNSYSGFKNNKTKVKPSSKAVAFPRLTSSQSKSLTDYADKAFEYADKADSSSNFPTKYGNDFKSAYYVSKALDNSSLKSLLRADANTGHKVKIAVGSVLLAKKLASLYKLKREYKRQMIEDSHNKNSISRNYYKIKDLISKIKNRIKQKR